MKYKNIKQIARLIFLGQDALENGGGPYSTLTYSLNDLNQIPLTDNSYIVMESVSFRPTDTTIIRCMALGSQLIHWDSTHGSIDAPIIFSNVAEGGPNGFFINPDPTTLYKFKIDKNFFSNNTIQFKFDFTLTSDLEKLMFQISFVIYDEEDVYLDTYTDIKKDDWKINKTFPKVY